VSPFPAGDPILEGLDWLAQVTLALLFSTMRFSPKVEQMWISCSLMSRTMSPNINLFISPQAQIFYDSNRKGTKTDAVPHIPLFSLLL
jgi:hypothetical protein